MVQTNNTYPVFDYIDNSKLIKIFESVRSDIVTKFKRDSFICNQEHLDDIVDISWSLTRDYGEI